MTPEQERALFVRQPFRYVTAKDDSIKAVNPQATEIQIDTRLDETAAQLLASNYLNANDRPRVFEIEIEGLIDSSAFNGGPPSFLPNLPEYGLETGQLTLVATSVDYNTGITKIEVRG